MIGEGSIGRVHLGKWQETDVAIKVLGSLNAVGLAMPGQPVQPALPASVVPAEREDSSDSDGSLANSYAAEQSMSLRTLEREVSLLPLCLSWQAAPRLLATVHAVRQAP